MKEYIIKIWKFLSYDIWRITEKEVTKRTFMLYYIVKMFYLSIHRFRKNQITNKAAALTYSTLLAIVPMLALLFAIARGLGISEHLEQVIRTFFTGDKLTLDTLLNFVDSYLSHTKNGVFIGVGLILFLWTILNLISNIEDTFNQIWEVKKGRSMFRKVTDYFSMLLLMPIFIVTSSGLSIFISTTVVKLEHFMLLGPVVKTLIHLIPFAITWLMFTGLYIFMPNTPIKFKHAFISGLLAGSLYQIFQYLYIHSQIWVSSYNAVYGSFAALPLFLIWLQISWTICLFGAELTHAKQNIHLFSFNRDTQQISRRYRKFISILVLSGIVKQFVENKPPYSTEQITQKYQLPMRLTNQIIQELQTINLVNEIVSDQKSESTCYQPAMDPSQITLGLLLERLETHGSENFKVDKDKLFNKEWSTIASLLDHFHEKANQILLKDL